MVAWYERAVQTSFKPTADGIVFQCPNPWLFGHWRHYLVNEAQKELLAAHLRQRQRLVLRLLAVYVLIALGLTMLFEWSGTTPDPTTGAFFGIVALAMLGMLALALLPHVYLMRKIQPLLAQLPRTDDRATLHEQLFGVAAVISNVHLLMGGVGGFLIALSNVKTIVESLSEGRSVSELYFSAFGLLVGVLMAGYFAYLAILKRRLKRKAN
jgi:hypothetical protein